MKSKYYSLFEHHLDGFEPFTGNKQAQAFCPFHDDKGSSKKGFNVNLETGLWYCYSGCGGGTAGQFVNRLGLDEFIPDTDYDRVIELVDVLRSDIEQIDKGDMGYPDGFKFVTGTDDSVIGKKAFEYLLERGLSVEQLITLRIGYCYTGRYRGRIIVPILDEEGHVEYFVARAFFMASGPPYLNPSNKSGYKTKQDVLFNYHIAKSKSQIVLCEGVFDAIAVGPQGVCIFGKSLSPLQGKMLRASDAKTIVIALDEDAKQPAIELAYEMRGFGKQIKFAMLPSGHDPGDMDRMTLAKCIINAESVGLSNVIQVMFE